MQLDKSVEEINILNIPVTVFDSYSHAVESIVRKIKNRQKSVCIAINPEKIYWAQKDADLRNSINRSDFHICDGIGAALAARILCRKKICRITGVQLFFNLISRAEELGLKVFLLGAKHDSNESAYKKLMEMHPNLQIVGRHDGYSNNQEEVIRKINNSNADMLFVAMGSPNQENWIKKYRLQINTPFCMGVGGTFDIVSGNTKWAPKFFRKTGTEFLYRLIKEPWRWKRQRVLLNFALQVIKSRFFTGHSHIHTARYKYEHLE